MILVDSSALIEFYRPSGDPTVRAAVAEVVAAGEVAVNGVIRVEILGFAARKEDRRLLLEDFAAFHDIDLERDHFDLACDLGFRLRRRGVTVPATDLIIAASAVRAEIALLHVDHHFLRIAEESSLLQRFLGSPP